MKRLTTALLASVLSACAVGPDYERPTIATPASWRGDTPAPLQRQADDHAWWSRYQDAALDALVRQALAGNPDLAVALARADEAAGVLGSTRAALFPQLDYSLQAGRTRASEAPPSAIRNPYGNHQVRLVANWELDLWGGLRRATEAARADLLAAEENRRAAVLTLVAAVVENYIVLRSLDRQLEISYATLEVRAANLRLFERRHQGGVISGLELAQVRAEYEDAAAAVPQLHNQIERQEHALALLLGSPPQPIARGRPLAELEAPAAPAGLPSDLLARRPDLRAAEQALIAANARIGQARARYYPNISLTGAAGSASAELSDLFTGPARIWSFAGAIAGPLFDAGATTSEVAQAQARHAQQLARYQQAIQAAFRDVEDALSDGLRQQQRLATQARQVDASGNYLRLAQRRYDNGYSSYLEVLDAQRSLFAVQLAQVQTRQARLQADVALYRALGGGWVDTADRLAAETRGPGQH